MNMQKLLKNVLSVAALTLGGVLFVCPVQNLAAEPPTPDDTSAVVYFLRPSAFGKAVSFALWDGEDVIGVVKGKQHIAYKTTPGTHYFLIHAQNWEIIKAELAAGKTYYIVVRPVMGFTSAAVNMTVEDPNNPDIPKWIRKTKVRNYQAAWLERYKQGGDRLADIQSALEKAKAGTVDVELMNASDGK
jgi:hypothetical protein